MLPECDSLLDLTSCRRHKLANMTNDVVRPIWFCQKSAFVGELCPLRGWSRRGNQQCNLRPVFSGMMREGKSVHDARHLNIGEQHMDAGRMNLNSTHGGFGVFDLNHLKACIMQCLDDDKANQLFILGHKDQNLVRHPFALQH